MRQSPPALKETGCKAVHFNEELTTTEVPAGALNPWFSASSGVCRERCS